MVKQLFVSWPSEMLTIGGSQKTYQSSAFSWLGKSGIGIPCFYQLWVVDIFYLRSPVLSTTLSKIYVFLSVSKCNLGVFQTGQYLSKSYHLYQEIETFCRMYASFIKKLLDRQLHFIVPLERKSLPDKILFFCNSSNKYKSIKRVAICSLDLSSTRKSGENQDIQTVQMV